ncbi:MAG: hypothetical protein SVU32_06810, partial [Candidatus Nanohaloarchaea archaeon]|nr:hypothetical protein [Candidatus Nanohaloarchaea archaeon]
EDLEDLERLLENKAARQTTEVWTPVTEWQAQAALGEHDDMVPTGFAVQDGRWHAIYTVVREDMELPPIEIGKGYSGTVQDPETGEKATTIDIAEPNSHVVEIASRLEREELATDWQEVETDG